MNDPARLELESEEEVALRIVGDTVFLSESPADGLRLSVEVC